MCEERIDNEAGFLQRRGDPFLFKYLFCVRGVFKGLCNFYAVLVVVLICAKTNVLTEIGEVRHEIDLLGRPFLWRDHI